MELWRVAEDARAGRVCCSWGTRRRWESIKVKAVFTLLLRKGAGWVRVHLTRVGSIYGTSWGRERASQLQVGTLRRGGKPSSQPLRLRSYICFLGYSAHSIPPLSSRCVRTGSSYELALTSPFSVIGLHKAESQPALQCVPAVHPVIRGRCSPVQWELDMAHWLAFADMARNAFFAIGSSTTPSLNP